MVRRIYLCQRPFSWLFVTFFGPNSSLPTSTSWFSGGHCPSLTVIFSAETGLTFLFYWVKCTWAIISGWLARLSAQQAWSQIDPKPTDKSKPDARALILRRGYQLLPSRFSVPALSTKRPEARWFIVPRFERNKQNILGVSKITIEIVQF